MKFVDPTGNKIVVRSLNEDNSFTEFEWLEHDGEWGFFDDNMNKYSGTEKHILETSRALSTLMEGNTGSSMIKELVAYNTRIRIESFRSNEYFPNQKAVGWAFDNGSFSAPFISLGHELAHALDDMRGTMNNDIWIPRGTLDDYTLQKDIPFNELFSTHIENMIRAEHNYPLRSTYLIGNDSPYTVMSRIIDSSGKSLYYNNQGKTTYNMIPPSIRFKY